jgi:hypothetical protein
VWTFPLRAKSEAFPALRHFFAWVSTQFGLTIKAVQCDNGREFDNSTSRDFFLSHGMQLRMSCPYTSSQNGKAERMIHTTNDTIRTLLLQTHLPTRLWAEALHTSTYLLNRLPSTVCPTPAPHQALFGTPPRYDHLCVFGCACYPNTAATAPHKLTPRSTLRVFLGYSPDHKGYRCFDLSSRRVLISRHVVFDEFMFPYSTTTTPPPPPTLTLTSSLSFRLTRWSSHLYFLSLQVLARRLSVLLPARCLARVRWCRLSAGPRLRPPPGQAGVAGLHRRWGRWCRRPPRRPPPGRAGVAGLHRLRGRRYRPLRPASHSRCGSTSAGPR